MESQYELMRSARKRETPKSQTTPRVARTTEALSLMPSIVNDCTIRKPLSEGHGPTTPQNIRHTESSPPPILSRPHHGYQAADHGFIWLLQIFAGLCYE